MAKSNVRIDLRGLEKMNRKLKKYEQSTTVSLPYTNEQ